jgi:uncharacterized membrane protein (DUF485 family)
MHHEPNERTGKDASTDYKARLGLILFFFYGLIYAGFVLINTLDPKLMGRDVLGDLNLAVVYGFGLIILAIVMGLIYHVACTRAEDRLIVPEEIETEEKDNS